MPANLLPLLALAAGFGVMASRSRRPQARRCTPEAFFGVVPFSEGGYPRAAEKRLEEWFNKPGSARYAAMSRGAGKEYQSLINARTAAKSEAEDDQIWFAMEDLIGPRMRKAWNIADAFLEAQGCPIREIQGADLKGVLKDKEAWLRWVMAIGAYVGMKNVVARSPLEQASDALSDAWEFIGTHFDILRKSKVGLFESGGGEEIKRYADLINSLSVPMAGKLQKYDTKLTDMTPKTAKWLFPPLPDGEAFLAIEDRIVRLQKDMSIFLTGQYVPEESGSSEAAISQIWISDPRSLTPWFPRYLGVDTPKTTVGWEFLYAYMDAMVGAPWPVASPDPERFTIFSEYEGLQMPSVAVRGRLNDEWWSDMGAKIVECLWSGVSLEETAVAALAEPPTDGPLCGGVPSDLQQVYPSYDQWWKDNQGADYGDYEKALDAFKAKYPAVYLGIHNMMSMIAQRYPKAAGDMGFGG